MGVLLLSIVAFPPPAATLSASQTEFLAREPTAGSWAATPAGMVPLHKITPSLAAALTTLAPADRVVLDIAFLWPGREIITVRHFDARETIPDESWSALSKRDRELLQQQWNAPGQPASPEGEDVLRLNENITREVVRFNAGVLAEAAADFEGILKTLLPEAEVLTDYGRSPPLVGNLAVRVHVYEIPTVAMLPQVGVMSIEEPTYPRLNWASPGVKANVLWSAGYTGSGVKIAVLDSGVSSNLVTLGAWCDFTYATTCSGGGNGSDAAAVLQHRFNRCVRARLVSWPSRPGGSAHRLLPQRGPTRAPSSHYAAQVHPSASRICERSLPEG
jgi:hypothetical protein